MSKKPLVSIIMGSDSDNEVMKEAGLILKEFSVPFEIKILSAHRSPKDTALFAEAAKANGIKVIIAGAGGAAHLAGVVASLTTLPVIGVPIKTKYLNGMDSLFSTVQMPGGVPVAAMAIGKPGAKNAGILAAEIIALSDKKIAEKLLLYRKKMVSSIRKKNKFLKKN